MVKSLMFSCGASKGMMFIGSLKCLLEKDKISLNTIKLIGGISIGSIFAFLLTIGYNIHELEEFITNFDFLKVSNEYELLDIVDSFGFEDGSKILIVLQELLKYKFNIEDITFKELYEKTNKTLLVQAVNLNKILLETFTYETHPDLSVLLAIRMSSAIPIIFKPILYNSFYYIDAGITTTIPRINIDYLKLKEINFNEIIYFSIENNCIVNEIESLGDYIFNIIRCIFNKSDIVPIESKLINLISDCDSIFPGKEDVLKLIESGYQQTLMQYNFI
jgi:patatin-like phospholipase/acyl hydrolase